ncbi:DUSA [Enterospora canceri]|uniref:tRNA-dihydrouridine synthase n=1 Tax=Enterospora canceri TaxID=1081671 RepID=A0A1Y1S9A6_9MICR|nr:DUSA [Enterospora canceri]
METNLKERRFEKELAVAPMLKVTTPCFRRFLGIISPTVALYTEMIVANTVVNVTDHKLRFLLGDPTETTVVQIGGSDPPMIATAVERLIGMGYDKFNLNCGCPSDRVQKGMFGAILMKHKELVSEIINCVYDRCGVIMTVKCRIGVDEFDSYDFFSEFISHIADTTKCRVFYVHARKCWLRGLNPRQNRNIPPLHYEFVHKIKEDRPNLFIGLNGGIKARNIDSVGDLDGAMIGREAWNNIEVFNEIRGEAVDMKEAVREYLEWCSTTEYSISRVVQPLINIRKGMGNSKAYKKALNDAVQNKTKDFLDFYQNIEHFYHSNSGDLLISPS